MNTEKIENHFQSLGGLEPGINLKKEGMAEPFVTELENYIGRQISKDLLCVLQKHEGQVFVSNETVGVDVSQKLPILGDSTFLEFGIFLTLNESSYKIATRLKSNDDLFGKEFLPFAEATPGDYIAYNLTNEKVYFISHDFNENEEFRFQISENLQSYFMSLKEENKKETVESTPKEKEEPKLLKVTYNADFLKRAKEEAQKMKEKKK